MSAKKNDQGIAVARALYREKKFSQVISILSPQIFLYRTNVQFYTLLGNSCLYSNDFGGAHTYLSRAIDLDPQEIAPKLGLAIVNIRRGKITEALQLWLDILSLDGNNPQAKIGLDYIRGLSIDENQSIDLNSKMIKKLYPPTGVALDPIKKMVSLILGVAIIFGISFMAYSWYTAPESISREGGELLMISSDVPRLAPGGSAEIILTASQIDEILRNSARAFDSFQDNRVRLFINRILLSNASEDIKTQMGLLQSVLRIPTFVDNQWFPTVRDVIENSDEYNGVFIRWSGQISNLQIRSESIEFDLLVGYQTQSVLEAIVPVRVDFAVDLKPGENIEIIGKLDAKQNDHFLIIANSIRYIR